MEDHFRTRELHDRCVQAQQDFNTLAAEFKAACEALDAAQAAKDAASAALNASFDEVATLARIVRDRGQPVLIRITDADLWHALSQGRELGEIEAALESCAPKKTATV